MSPDAAALLAWTERQFGHAFKNAALCLAALTHRSAGGEHNERLEFLGDAVLNCSVARLLYDAHPDADEGALSRLRASLVSGETLAQVAADLKMGEHLQLGSGELRSGGYRTGLDPGGCTGGDGGSDLFGFGLRCGGSGGGAHRGQGASRNCPRPKRLKDAKTRLQEALQGRGLGLPVYVLTAAAGEPHAQSFTVTCEVPIVRAARRGRGRQPAARRAAGGA